MENAFSKRSRLDLCRPAELAIYKAMGEIEELGADVILTESIIKLQQALNLVSDYINEK